MVYTGVRKMSRQEAQPYLALTTTTHYTTLPDATSSTFNIAFDAITDQDCRLRWVYARRPLSPPEKDALYTPLRSNQAAKEIPDALYKELHAVSQQVVEPYSTLLKSITARDGDRKFNWLMRTTELSTAQQQHALEQRACFIGDAVHAMPIGSHLRC